MSNNEDWDWGRIRAAFAAPQMITGGGKHAGVQEGVEHGEHALNVENRPDLPSPLPSSPAIDGVYIYLGAVYPLINLEYNLFELYHHQSDHNVPRATYVTDEPLMKLQGDTFESRPESHRLQWIREAEDAVKFVDFITSYSFKSTPKKRMYSLYATELTVAWPNNAAQRTPYNCLFVMPYSGSGEVTLIQEPGVMLQAPVFGLSREPTPRTFERAQEEKALWPS